jgi:hypothetical protein
MPYSFSKPFEELTGRPCQNRPIFQPRTLTPLRKAIAESRVGLFASCGAQLPEDPKLGDTEDISFRLIPRKTPVSKLMLSDQTKVRKWAVEDPDVAFPLDRGRNWKQTGRLAAWPTH